MPWTEERELPAARRGRLGPSFLLAPHAVFLLVLRDEACGRPSFSRGSLVHLDNDTYCRLISAEVKSVPHLFGQRAEKFSFWGREKKAASVAVRKGKALASGVAEEGTPRPLHTAEDTRRRVDLPPCPGGKRVIQDRPRPGAQGFPPPALMSWPRRSG